MKEKMIILMTTVQVFDKKRLFDGKIFATSSINILKTTELKLEI